MREFVFLCGEVDKYNPTLPVNDAKFLNLSGDDPNIVFKLGVISENFKKEIPEVFLDLMEIAAYVFCADQSATRGGDDRSLMDKYWRRKMILHIPVRKPETWESQKVMESLRKMLNFISDDEYHFEFRKQTIDKPENMYLEMTYDDISNIEEVMLYSGGLDSLAGAVDEIVNKKRKVALINHFSSTVRQSHIRQLNEKFSQFYSKNRPFYIPVSLHRIGGDPEDNSQRTRSFLYMSIAASISKMLGLSRIKIFENGIISFNLPISEQLTGAKATRTTHPKTVKLISDFLNTIYEESFKIETPFIWKTKADIVKIIKDAGCGELIGYSRSCSRVNRALREYPHCGTCIQCIERRFAVLYSECEKYDPAEKYGVDLLTGERKDGDVKTIAESYIKTTQQLKEMFSLDNPELQFFSKYPEAYKILASINESHIEKQEKIINLYERFGQQIDSVIKKEAHKYITEFIDGKLPNSSMLIMALPQKYFENRNGSTKKLQHSVHSDLEGLIDDSTDKHTFLHTDDYSRVVWDGIEFYFKGRPAQAIQFMHRLFKEGKRFFNQSEILEDVESASTNVRLTHIFSNHKSWGTFIISKDKTEGKKTSRSGFYGLNL